MSNHRLSKFLQMDLNYFLVLDSNLRIQDYSENWLNFLGKTEKDFTEENFLNLVLDTDQNETKTELEKIKMLGESSRFRNMLHYSENGDVCFEWKVHFEKVDNLYFLSGTNISEVFDEFTLLERTHQVAGVGTWWVDIAKNQPNWSDRTYEIHGVEVGSEIKMEEAINYYVPEHRPIIQEAVEKGIASKKGWNKELKITTAQGEERWVHALGYPVFKDDNLVRLEGTFQDIDKRKKQDAVMESIFYSYPDALVFTNLDGKILNASASFNRLFGFEDNNSFGVSCSEIFDTKTDYQKLAKTHIVSPEVFNLKKVTGVVFRGEIVGGIVSSEAGEEIGILFSIRDITEAELRQTQLESLTRRLELSLEASQIGVWEFDLVDNQLFWDDHMYTIYGVRDHLEVAPYSLWQNALHPDDTERAEKEVMEAIEGTKQFNTVFRILTPSGETRNIKAMAQVLRNDAGKPITMLGVNWDVTAQKQLEAKLQEEKEKAEAANFAKSMFLANMSHEIRTPMNGILGMANVLKDSGLGEEYEEKLSVISNSSEALLQIINDILDISKLEAGKFDLDLSPISFKKFTNDLKGFFDFQTKQKDIEFILDYNEDLYPYLLGDQNKIRQILINLIGNAVKFTDSGHVKLSVKVTNDTEKIQKVRFEVSDTGIGITKKKQGEIFQIFTQEDISTRRRFGGTGLGLAISQQFSNLMGSQIIVDSTPGVGSKFYFEITLLKTENNKNSEHFDFDVDVPVNEELGKVYPLRILTVDDNLMNLMVAKSTLKKIGYSCDTAKNGLEAIEQVKKSEYDVILLDCHMPLMDGFEFAEWFKQQKISGKLVALTASIMQSDVDRMNQVGMDYILSKPLNKNELAKRLVSVAQGKEKKVA